MNIKEATRIAMETNNFIARKSKQLLVKPTNDWECCLLIHPTKEEYAPRWNPKAEDLMAIDWEVVDWAVMKIVDKKI